MLLITIYLLDCGQDFDVFKQIIVFSLTLLNINIFIVYS